MQSIQVMHERHRIDPTVERPEMRTYTPQEFSSLLARTDLPDPTVVELFGMVKHDADSPSSVSFTDSTACQSWRSIPLDMIESIDHLRAMPCQDHEHPLVKIILRQPVEERPDVAFLLGMVSQYQASLSRVAAAARPSRDASRGECTDCRVVGSERGLVVCCWCGDNEIVCTGIA